MTANDRRVHGRAADGTEVVRYDRAGKWWIEDADGSRRPLSLAGAVDVMRQPQSIWYPGVLGGRAFDARVIKFRSSR